MTYVNMTKWDVKDKKDKKAQEMYTVTNNTQSFLMGQKFPFTVKQDQAIMGQIDYFRSVID